MRTAPTVRLLSAALLLAGGATAATSQAAAVPQARFSQPMLLAGGGAEPSIRVPGDKLSAAYVSAPSGMGSNFWRITEKKNPDRSTAFVQSPVQQPDLGTGGGDSEISVGNAPYGETRCYPIAYSGLHNIDALNNFTVARSTDCGKTFTLTNPVGTQNTLTDRQWQTFDGAKTNFLIFHKVDTSQIVVAESIDAGNTYVSLSPDGAHGIIDPTTAPSVGNNNQVGNITTDYATPTGSNNLLSGEPTHVLYATFGGPADPADNAAAQVDSNLPTSAYNHIDTIYVAKSTDGGVTWKDTKVFSVPPTSRRELNLLFPVVATDRKGNVYSLWSDGFRIQYAVSTDHGLTWSAPHQVNHDNRGALPDTGRADLFPWMGAGADGMLDVVWYHGSGGAPGSNLKYRNPGDKSTHWTVAFAQLGNATARDGSGAASPRELTYSDAVTPVIHTGAICNNGIGCDLIPGQTGDRSLLDFFQVAIDKAGRANIALADNEAAPGANISAYIRQTSGYSLTTGRLLPREVVRPPVLTCAADASFTDPAGDATQVAGVATPLPNAPALDIVRGYVTFDAARKVVVLHTKMLDLKQDPPQGATGEQVEFSFAYAGQTFQAVGDHDVTQTADSFHMEQFATTRTTVGGPLTGAFDKASSEVRVDVPVGLFAAAGKGPVVKPGARFTGLAITTRRDDANLVVPTADVAGGLGCPFIVPSGRVRAHAEVTPTLTVPAGLDTRPVPLTAARAARLPATGSPTAVALVAAGLLLAVAGFRRRRPVRS
ncbi:MAG: glycoside hydrolase [Actinomycetota bacterium]|nr:glycoside hydrolase [Actinomycetota bacterium]